MNRWMALVAVLLAASCGLKRVDSKAVAALPLEGKLDLIEAENDLFIAVDSLDEAISRALETRDELMQIDSRIQDAREALDQARGGGTKGKKGSLTEGRVEVAGGKETRDQKALQKQPPPKAKKEQLDQAALVEIAQLSLTEARQRRDWLDASLDVQWAQVKVERARLDAAWARFERNKAQIVKKANVPGAQAIDLAAFDKQVKGLEADVKKEAERAERVAKKADKVRVAWDETRKQLAQRTGGALGSPWVE